MQRGNEYDLRELCVSARSVIMRTTSSLLQPLYADDRLWRFEGLFIAFHGIHRAASESLNFRSITVFDRPMEQLLFNVRPTRVSELRMRVI